MAEGRELYEQSKQLEKSIHSRSRCRREAERIRLLCRIALGKSKGIEQCTEDSRDWPYFAMAEKKAEDILKRLR